VTRRVQERQVGDLITAIAATLQRPDGTAIDVTNLTVTFAMVNSETGAVKVNNAAATKDDAANGQVSYAPVAADVDTEGTFFGYFRTEDGNSKIDTFPAKKGDLQIRFHAKA
jgi:hypothetical protein